MWHHRRGHHDPNTVGHQGPDTMGHQQHAGVVNESLEQGSQSDWKVYIPGDLGEPEKSARSSIVGFNDCRVD